MDTWSEHQTRFFTSLLNAPWLDVNAMALGSE
jgi:hypothetical protein